LEFQLCKINGGKGGMSQPHHQNCKI